MKKYICLFFGIAFLLSCSEETSVDKVVNTTSSGGALRTLKIENNLEATDMTSTYSILLEAQTVDEGKLLKEVRVKVGGYFDKKPKGGYRDTVKTSSFSTIPAAEFNKEGSSTNKLPIGEFTATLQQLADHVGKTKDQLSHDDEFLIHFEMELTDGRIYNASNASGDITRTGRFSYFNSRFSYTAAINAKQTLITDFMLSSKVKSNGLLNKEVSDTLFIVFNDGAKKLASASPFFKVTTLGTASSGNLGTIGEIALVVDTLDDDKYEYGYYFRYTPSDVEQDTISFVIEGAATHDVKVPMDEPDTLKNVFIIDNIIKFKASKPQVLVDGNLIKTITIDFDFDEALRTSKDSINFRITSSSFDDIDIKESIEEEDVEIRKLTFTPKRGDAQLQVSSGTLEFNVSVTKAKDKAGNEVDQQADFSLFN